MAGRPLSPEEKLIWSKVTQSVKPIHERHGLTEGQLPAAGLPANMPLQKLSGRKAGIKAVSAPLPAALPARSPAPVLDDSWERRIATGALIPEMTVDLHGHTLDSAHKRLNQILGAAVARGVRVLLVVTGNPRPASSAASGQRPRGAIRAEIGDWLALSGHADTIASVRNAHPRHGGKGALYIILRRRN